ncbi:sensor histidine kinase [Actinopolymorpha alba]|uniref:sensor histidine kinase n=1 Tax=Actinopolymorpha alba TaxID=533267 RepID=UPI00036563B2|nr:HAMP domain-containing sensor histidine kinase [Actinopolymorpha alba]
MRKRIVTLVVLAAVLAISLFGIPLAVGVAHSFVTDESTELERLADTAADLVQQTHVVGRLTGPESGTDLALYDRAGRLVAGNGPAQADILTRRTLRDNIVHRDTVRGMLTVTVPVGGSGPATGVMRASAPRSALYPQIGATWLMMVGLGLLAVSLTGLVAHAQVRRLTAPLDALTAAAGRLGEGDFSVRAAPSGLGEIDAAGEALNRTAARLGSLVERERAFTADASHQLRTPLTGLRFGLEAALEGPPEQYRDAMIAAIADADRLERITKDLLVLARDAPQGSARLDVAVVLEDLRRDWHGQLAAAGRPLRIAIDRDLPASTASVAAVRQVLAVLVENAVQHGSGVVSLRARDSAGALAIDVRNEGCAITIDEGELFSRRSAGAHGHGIGLALARSLAEAEGGRLHLTAADPPTFTLLLPVVLSEPPSAPSGDESQQ